MTLYHIYMYLCIAVLYYRLRESQMGKNIFTQFGCKVLGSSGFIELKRKSHK